MNTKKSILIIVLCIAGLICASAIWFSVCGLPFTDTKLQIQHPINIDITFPTEGGTVNYDVVPAGHTVFGTILSDYEIESAYVKSFGYGEPELTKITSYTGMLCGVPTTPGKTNITVVVTDVKGNTAEKTINFTVITGPPAPPKEK